MKKTATGLLLIFALSGCAMPETKIYTLHLRPEAPTQQRVHDAAVAVVVTAPRYFSQPYIVYRNSSYQLGISRYAKWPDPPDDMLRDAFKESLANNLFREVRTPGINQEGIYVLNIDLRHFERRDEGDAFYAEVAFEATFHSPQGKILFQQSFARKTRLEDKSFANLAKGLSHSLEEGTNEIKGKIEKSMNP